MKTTRKYCVIIKESPIPSLLQLSTSEQHRSRKCSISCLDLSAVSRLNVISFAISILHFGAAILGLCVNALLSFFQTGHRIQKLLHREVALSCLLFTFKREVPLSITAETPPTQTEVLRGCIQCVLQP